jgi:tRNA(Ile)-lysidine synthase
MRLEQKLTMGGLEMTVFRPLLGVRREALRDWLRSEKLRWREDATNAESHVARNRLRHEALPLLSEIARRDVVGPLVKAADADAELRAVQAWAVVQAGVTDPQGRLHVPKLRELPEALRRACVFDHLKQAGVADLDRAGVERVLGMLADGGPAKVMLSGGRLVRRRQGRVFIES